MSATAAVVLEGGMRFGKGGTAHSTSISNKVVIVYRHSFELWTAPAWLSERMAQDFPQLNVVHLPEENLLTEEIADTDVLIAWSIEPEQFAGASKLKWIHSPAAGVNQLMRPDLISSEVVITNARQVHAPLVAEHALTCMLALAKRVPQCVRCQAGKEWGQQKLWAERPRPRQVAGATVLLIGMGSIGSEFTARAKALGMRVLAIREHPEKGTDGADAVYGPAQLDDLLPQADYVLLCTPVTPTTIGLMNRARLARMKPSAYLINVGRGELVDEAALLEALQNRRIGGAAVDVFTQEPLPAESPFWSLDNLLITPHLAAATESIWERHYELIFENMAHFLAGRPLLNEVDKQRGY
jgi:phosphoglycerate dehydrogenase-like enzyme